MSPDDASKLTGVGRSTITGWTSNEFREFFSPTAQAANGRARDLSEHDLRLLVFLKQETAARRTRPEIIEALRQLQAKDWRDLPDVPYGADRAVVPMLPMAAADAALTSERRLYIAQIELLEEQLQQAQQQTEHERAKNEPLLREIGDLKAELARAQLMLELYESGRLKPTE